MGKFCSRFGADWGDFDLADSRYRLNTVSVGSGPVPVELYCLVLERLESVVSQVSKTRPGAPGGEVEDAGNPC